MCAIPDVARFRPATQELLKYEVQDMSSGLSLDFSAGGGPGRPGKRITLLSLVCRVMDEAMHLNEPAIEIIGWAAWCRTLNCHLP